jgi:hypothetical protein
MPSQRHEVILVDDTGDDDDKENTLVRPGRGVVRRKVQGQLVIDGPVIDLSAEITKPPPRVDNDDVISIESDD